MLFDCVEIGIFSDVDRAGLDDLMFNLVVEDIGDVDGLLSEASVYGIVADGVVAAVSFMRKFVVVNIGCVVVDCDDCWSDV